MKLYSLFIAMVLVSDCYIISPVMSMNKVEDSSSEREALSAFLNEEVAKGPFGSAASGGDSGRNTGNKGAASRIIMVADAGLWRGPKMLGRGVALVRHRDLGVAISPEDLLTTERRETSQDSELSIPIGRRDTMRCMVGRVYRPCWEM
ncbi:pro-melanin-concentrating hormone, like [Paramormyrops kingsleyae]|uniref:pro-melanin-concentrating hormone, like n=1 Tax=Paramormyrops kingsleyae TaxID=1676925 RepID=UPI000CD5D19A|nr:pro-MCH 2-like [Paramormyrops kingsleyae]